MKKNNLFRNKYFIEKENQSLRLLLIPYSITDLFVFFIWELIQRKENLAL